jgi:tRNA (cytidine/uridine-2'-O-)-methyltransferase
VLVEPEIHWNVGNAGRTCLAAGAKLHLVRPLGFSLSDRRVKRAGLDYWPRVNPKMWVSFEALEESLPSLGMPYFVSPHTSRTLWDVEYPSQTVLLFGRESVGFAPQIREKWADKLVGIPMLDSELRSLNL